MLSTREGLSEGEPPSIPAHAVAAGLSVVSFDHKDNRVVLAVAPRLALAA